MSEKLPVKIRLSVVLITLAGQLAWGIENQYFNIFMYNKITPIPIYISFMVAASAITATITSIIMGAVSDIKGNRRIFFIIGFIFWAITTALFSLSGFIALFNVILAVVFAILFDCLMTFFGSTAYDAAFNAYVTDITTLKNRGRLLSIVQIMTLFSILIIYGISGFIIDEWDYYIYFFIVAFLVGVIGIGGALLARDSPKLHPLNISIYNHLKTTLNIDTLRANRDFFLVLSGAALWGLAFNIFFPFVMIYMEHYLHLDIITSSILILFLFVFAMIFAYPMGMLIDKVGRKKVGIISVAFESGFLILFALSNELVFLVTTGTVWVLFMTTFTISANTWTKDLYPENKHGQFSGYFILFTVLLPMIPGPLIGGWLSQEFGIYTILDGQPGYIPTPIIFIASALMILLTIVPLIFAKESNQKINVQE